MIVKVALCLWLAALFALLGVQSELSAQRGPWRWGAVILIGATAGLIAIMAALAAILNSSWTLGGAVLSIVAAAALFFFVGYRGSRKFNGPKSLEARTQLLRVLSPISLALCMFGQLLARIVELL